MTYAVTRKLITVYGAEFALIGQQQCDAKLLAVKEVPQTKDILIISSHGQLIIFHSATRAFQALPLE